MTFVVTKVKSEGQREEGSSEGRSDEVSLTRTVPEVT